MNASGLSISREDVMSNTETWVETWINNNNAVLGAEDNIYAHACDAAKRPRASSLSDIMGPHPKRQVLTYPNDNTFLPHAFDLRSTTTNSSENRGSSRKSSSPKRKADLELCEPSIKFVESADISEDEREIFHQVRDAAETLPLSLKSHFESHPVVKRTLKRVLWTADVEESKSEDLWRAARKIEDNARLCSAEDRPEDSWSDLVVFKILELAIELSGLERCVSLLTLKSVGVDPRTLLPQHVPGGALVSMRVDYGYGIELDEEEMARVELVWQRQKPPGTDEPTRSVASERSTTTILPSLGPSTLPLLRKRPLFCNIEVKKETSASDPRTQLGIWSSAVLSRWEQLGNPLDVPFLLCWTVKGHLWQLHIARRGHDGGREISSTIESYHTNNLVHIFYIIFAMRYILRWGNEDFRKSFIKLLLSNEFESHADSNQKYDAEAENEPSATPV